MENKTSRRKFLRSIGVITAGIVGLPLLNSCSEYIDFTPYQIKVDTPRHQTKTNLDKLAKINSKEFKNFKIALISDTHTYYDNFERAVNSINSLEGIDFVIHCGDLTLSAISKEFEWASDLLNKINVPVLTVIGNHDYLSNGEKTYKYVFGDLNYSFVFNNCKFVMFDNVYWEKNLMEPDFDWFNENITNDQSYQHVIPVSHIPPWDKQFPTGNQFYFNHMMEAKNIELSIHGHTHSYEYSKRYDGLDYLTINDIDDRQYVVLDVMDDKLKVNIVKF